MNPGSTAVVFTALKLKFNEPVEIVLSNLNLRPSTTAKSATIAASVIYRRLPTVDIDTSAVIRVGSECAADEFVGYGNVALSVPPMASMELHTSVKRHCIPPADDAAKDAKNKYAWNIDFEMPLLSVMGGRAVH